MPGGLKGRGELALEGSRERAEGFLVNGVSQSSEDERQRLFRCSAVPVGPPVSIAYLNTPFSDSGKV